MEKVTRPYEILVRFNPDGSAAAHIRKMVGFLDGDIFTPLKELDPEPLALAGPEFNALVPALDQAMLKQSADLIAERDGLKEQNQVLQAQRDALEFEVAGLRPRGEG